MSLVAIDWGTSSLRGALLDDDGKVIEERLAPRGILSVASGGFGALFEELFGDWMRDRRNTCLISGMAGSKQGWVEAPYCACPAGQSDLAQKIIEIEPGRIAVVPGLSDMHDGVPDVMRGEEVQVFGALALGGMGDGLFVLPGTHSKWVSVKAGKVTGFRTAMTGEFYALLSQHSILARTMEPNARLDEAAFLEGVARADNGRGLLHNAFGTRTLALFDRMPARETSSYLSGLLIGEELRSQSFHSAGELVLIGTPALTQRYRLALGRSGKGLAVRSFGAEATWAGLHALSQVIR
ncbi:putative 2-dehydro-3-deoxygalactonokinase DgoK1 [Burkholderiales bacterium 8X]|nr:putative 2-dehydro-3-deoxygalactonokinase DgoK1 [Burkholderiales bacterium 8X]